MRGFSGEISNGSQLFGQGTLASENSKHRLLADKEGRLLMAASCLTLKCGMAFEAQPDFWVVLLFSIGNHQ